MTVTLFLFGVSFATFMFCGVFFLKFWKASRDQFFLFFCIACWLLAFERIVLLYFTSSALGTQQGEVSSWVYLIRLLAFAVILAAIVIKNKGAKKS